MEKYEVCLNCFNPRICIEGLCDHCKSSDEDSQNKAHWEELPEFDIWGYSEMTSDKLSDVAYCDAGLSYLDQRERVSALIRELAIRAGLVSRDNDLVQRSSDTSPNTVE